MGGGEAIKVGPKSNPVKIMEEIIKVYGNGMVIKEKDPAETDSERLAKAVVDACKPKMDPGCVQKMYKDFKDVKPELLRKLENTKPTVK